MHFWPGAAFAAVEYAFVGRQVPGFVGGVGAALVTMPLVTATVFYAYTAVLGKHVLTADIVLFLVAAVIGQLAGYWVMVGMMPHGWLQIAGGVAIGLMAAAFAFFSYLPPRVFLFRDWVSKGFGIQS